VDDAWYYEDIVDTTESQDALGYQKHSLDAHFAAVRPSGATKLAMKLLGGSIVKKLVRDSPYYGKEQTPDTAEAWVRVCEVFGVNPTLRDPLLERIAKGA
jgi:hypothetical protein